MIEVTGLIVSATVKLLNLYEENASSSFFLRNTLYRVRTVPTLMRQLVCAFVQCSLV